MTKPILQTSLPEPPWLDPQRWKLPGVQPLPPEEWLIRDEVFEQQMALRDELISTRLKDVHALCPEALSAAQECYDLVLDNLKSDPGYRFAGHDCLRPDGQHVSLDRDQPLITLGRLIQDDICLMQPGVEEHALNGAILCFPAYWTLSEKIGRPLGRIHTPVPEYDENLRRRVQRLFDAIRPEQPLWRMNANLHRSGDLFAPKRESDPESRVGLAEAVFVRSERQVLRKLPRTGATVFLIHTYMVRIADLDTKLRDTLWRLVPGSHSE